MKPLHFSCLLILVYPMVFAQSVPVTLNRPLTSKNPVPVTLSQPDPATQGRIVETYGTLPLSFEANHDQTDAQVKFLSRGSGYTLFLTGDEAVFSLHGSNANVDASPASRQVPTSATVPAASAVLRMKLVKANRSARVTGTDELPGKSNYFIGNDPKKWRSNVPTYTKVKYEGIYPGIDLVYYGNQRQLEYDFLVAPGADPHRIKLDVRGAEKISRDKDGDLVLHMANGEVRWHKPVVYQETDGKRNHIEGHYVIRHRRRVEFEIGTYDGSRPLIIDPALGYSTYLGGSNNDFGISIAVDSFGNAYATGETCSTDFPVTDNAFQRRYAGGFCGSGGDAFVTKLNAEGAALIYSTYAGGSNDDVGLAITVDGSGSAYITGQTASPDFPTTPGVFQPLCNRGNNCGQHIDAFVLVLNASGSGLVYSSYLGGSNDDYGTSVSVDSLGDAFVTGATCSGDFPTTPGAFQPSYGGGGCDVGDAFVVKVNSIGSALLYSTYLGGNSDEYGSGIAVNDSGNAYVTGGTGSANFPTTPGAFQTACSLGCAFVTEFNPTGTGLSYSTYIGGGLDGANAIALDGAGDAYITGATSSTNFPTTPGAFQTTCGGDCANNTSDAFVTELNPTGSTLIYSTYLGGSDNDYGFGIGLDNSGNAYLTGFTKSNDFPIAPGALQAACNDTSSCLDAFITEFNANGSSLIYSSYLGGISSDVAYGITVDSDGNPYITGYTASSDFPASPGTFQSNFKGATDAFVTKLVSGDQVWPLSLNFGNQPLGLGSNPQNATLTNSGTTPLTITSVAVTGANSGDFSQTNNCPASLAVGTSCKISITFTPAAIGTRNAALSITDDAANSPQTVILSGTGIPATVTLSPKSLNFGNQPVGTSSNPLPVLLSTDGSLTINSITTTAHFSQSNNCGRGLPAGGNCTINVTFTPAAPGLQNGTLMITDNGQGSPQTVPLSGTGTQPAVMLAPPSLSFGNQTVGITSSPQLSTLTNTGNGTLTITSITVTGVNSGDFAEKNNCPGSLPPNGNCSISVTFAPKATGTRNAAVSITDNAPGSPQSVPLTGVGVLPAVTFSPTSLTFLTEIVFGTSPAQKVTLTNAGLGILTILGGGISSPFGGTTTCKRIMQPGASCTISVVFKPEEKGVQTGAITVKDNAPDNPQTVPLTGTGTYVLLKPTSLNFGTQPVGTTSPPKYITLSNKGSGAVNISGISITGANSGDFAQQNNCGTGVPRGGYCTIRVTFTPTAQGKRTAAVSVSDDGGGSPQTVPVTGTGTP